MLGATTEFSKLEGLTFDPTRNLIYAAMSSVKEGMEDFGLEGAASNEFDLAGNNDIRLPYNDCGCGAFSCNKLRQERGCQSVHHAHIVTLHARCKCDDACMHSMVRW